MEGIRRELTATEEDPEVPEPVSEVKRVLKEQLTSRLDLESLDADCLPVLASLLHPRFKNIKFFEDVDDKDAAKFALLLLMKADSKT